MSLEQFISVLQAFKRHRAGGRGFSAFSELDYLRLIQSFVSAKFQCNVWFGGSLALYLQGRRENYGDVDLLTDRMFSPEDLPWRIENDQGLNLKSRELELDLFFRQDEKHLAILEMSKARIVEVNGLWVQEADFVENVNWCWSENEKDDKPRQCRKPDERVLQALLDALCLHAV